MIVDLKGKHDFGKIVQCQNDPIHNDFLIVNDRNELYIYNPVKDHTDPSYHRDLFYQILPDRLLPCIKYSFI